MKCNKCGQEFKPYWLDKHSFCSACRGNLVVDARVNMKHGKHSLTFKADKIVVESNFGKHSMVSKYSLGEYQLALATFNKLTEG